MAKEYKTKDDAAAAALYNLLHNGPQTQERMGAIVPTPDGEYTYTPPANTSEQPGSHSKVRVPSNLVGLYHDHPLQHVNDVGTHRDSDTAKKFSPGDVNIANRLNIPSYIAVQGEGDAITQPVYKYKPGTSRPDLSGTQGSTVLADIPRDAIASYIQQKHIANEAGPPAPVQVAQANTKKNRSKL